MTNHLTFTITILIISFTSTIQNAKAFPKCSDHGPQTRFPFYQNTLHGGPETNPGFELRCAEETGSTVIRFPSHDGDLAVKSVSYDARKLDLTDPERCVHRVFLDLDLSLTPFRYYYRLKSYTYLNCSAELTSHDEIPCLSGHGRHVYTVEPHTEVPVSCEAIKTVGIPFGYSPYLDDDSFGLGLTWDDKSSVLRRGVGGFVTAGLLQGTHDDFASSNFRLLPLNSGIIVF